MPHEPPSSDAPAAGSAAAARPIFVVGCQRSGTTALAVMLDRHSRIAMLPETHFFNRFVKMERARRLPMNHAEVVRRALDDAYIRDTHLEYEDLLKAYRPLAPTLDNLLRAILTCYVRKHAKQRPAEKSCGHLFNVRQILEAFPEAKIICILRDGRDVVRSLLKVRVSWGKPRSVPLLCCKWLAYAREAQRGARTFPPDAFTHVKYEDLIAEPEREMRRLCAFIGETYEEAQIRSGSHTDVVPKYELEWKGKAEQRPDPSRITAWRRCGDPMLIAQMNYYMGSTLAELGYPETDVRGASWCQRLHWSLRALPYRRGVLPLALRLNRVARSAKAVLRGGHGATTPQEREPS
jgi:hypothetical protein